MGTHTYKKFHFTSILKSAIYIFIASSCENHISAIEKTDFEIHRGVNIGNWLSGEPLKENRRHTVFTIYDVDKLKSYGFDHLRIPFDENNLFTKTGKRDNESLLLIHKTIKRCQKNGMKVILDLHSTQSHTFKSTKMSYNTLWDSREAQKRVVKIWEILMSEFDKYSEDVLAYELLNEPIAPNDEQWNQVANMLLKVIRNRNKKRVIVLGANRWNYVGKINKLDIPAGDSNILLSFHFYEPMLLTHYKASFNEFANFELPEKMKYPGKLFADSIYSNLAPNDQILIKPYRRIYDKEYFRERWLPAIKFAKSKGLKLYLGEFGCLPNAGEDIRLTWLRDVVSLCKEYDIAYSYWEYNNVFGFAERGTGKVKNHEMLIILTE